MEPIVLNISSPKVATPGLDDALTKLRSVDDLLNKLASPGRIRISFNVEGTGAIDAATANLNALKATLRDLGQEDLSVKLEKGLVTAGEVAQFAQKQVGALIRELEVASLKSVQMQGKFESLDVSIKGGLLSFNQQDKFAAARKELQAAINEADVLQTKLGAFQRLTGLAEGVSGTPTAVQSMQKMTQAAQEQVDHQTRLGAAVAKAGDAAEKAGGKWTKLFDVWQQLKQEQGFSDISIADIVKRSGMSKEDVHAQLREMSRRGLAHPTIGDWSKAGEEERAAAMDISSVPQLRVKLTEGVVGHEAEPHFAKLAQEEQKLTGAAIESAGALEHQSEIVKAKIKAMNDLGRVTRNVQAEEKQLASSVNASAEAEQRAGEVSRRILRDRQGNISKQFRTFVGAPGETTREVGAGITSQTVDQIAKVQAALADVKSEFSGRRAALSDAGFGKTTPEQLNLVNQEVAARQAILERMKAAGLEGDRLYRQEGNRSRQMQEAVARQQQVNAQRSTQEIRANVGERLDTAFKERASLLDREYQSQKALNISDAEHVDLLRRQSVAYGELSDAMKAAGRGGTPGQLSAAKSSEVTSARAAGIEADIARQESEAMRAEISARMDAGFTQRAAQLEREYMAEKQMIATRLEEIRLLDQQSAAYARLAQAMETSGRGGSSAHLSAVKKSDVMAAQAISMENEMMAEASRIATITADAQAKMGSFGGTNKKTDVSEGPTGKTVRTQLTRDDPDGYRRMIELTERWDAAGNRLVPTLHQTETALEGTGRSATAAGKSMLDNLGSITAWAAAVAVLYKSLALLTFGAESMAKLEFASARLSAVFRGTNEELTAHSATIVDLRDKTLALAVANGRNGEEALDASVRWARLGLTQRETLEAVDVSLKAANVAEITTAEAAEHLSAIYAAYRLQVGDLRTVLGELNAISNTYNVTNKDLLGGLARSSAIAKQAGLSFAELIGIIGAGVGRTGRTGAEIGNAVKAIIVSLSNPKIQEFLNTKFSFEVKAPTGDLKDMSTVLNELFIAFQKLNKSDQGVFLQKIGGKMQASRLQAILDGYTTSQMLAIKAQRDLGSAERENEKIRETTLSQLNSLSVAFQRLATNTLTSGGGFSVAAQFGQLIKLVTNLLNLLAEVPGVLVLIGGLIIGIGLRIANALKESGRDTGLLGRTMGHVRDLWAEVATAIRVVNGELVQQNALLKANAASVPKAAVAGTAAAGAGAAAAGAGAAAIAGRAAGGSAIKTVGKLIFGTLFSEGFIATIAITAAIEGLMWVINKAFEHFSTNAATASDKLGIYNKELERTKALSEASDMASRLAGTVSKALPDIQKRDPRAAQQALEDFASIAYSREEDPQGRQREALKQELVTLLEAGKIKEVQVRLAAEENRLTQQKRGYAAEELHQKQRALDQQAYSIALLQREIEMRKNAHKDTIAQEQKLQELMRLQAATRGEVNTAFTATYDAEQESVSETETEYGKEFTGGKKKTGGLFKNIEEVIGKQPLTSSEDDETEKIERKMEMIRQEIALMEEKKRQVTSTSQDAVSAAHEEYEAAKKQFLGLIDVKKVRENLVKQLDAERRKAQIPLDFGNEMNRGPMGDAARLGIGRMPMTPEMEQQAFNNAKRAADEARAKLEEFDKDPAGYIERELAKNKTNTPAGDALQTQRDAAELEKKAREEQETKRKAIDEEVEAQRKLLEEKRKELEIAKQAAILQDAITEGARKAKQESVQFQIGRNQTEQLVNEARGIGTDAVFQSKSQTFSVSGLLGQAEMDRERAVIAGDKVAQSRAEAEILGLTNRLSQIGVTLEERRYVLARDIANERAREQEEASKALLTASREEQLRAALVKKFTDQTGHGFDANQFGFLEKGTQEAITRFNPDSAPPEINTKLRDMQREQAELTKNIQDVTGAIKDTVREIRDNLKINTQPANPAVIPAPPQVNLPPVALQFAEQFQGAIAVLRDTVVTSLQAEIGQMRSDFATFKTQLKPAVAQNAGADSMS